LARTGIPSEVRHSLGSTVLFDALRSGEVDTYIDYSGTLWATVMHKSDVPASRESAIAEVRHFLQQNYGIELLGALGFENAYALAMRRSQAQALGVHKLSDLAAHAPRLALGADYEFLNRAEWRNLSAKYGLHFREQRSMDPSLMYTAAAHS